MTKASTPNPKASHDVLVVEDEPRLREMLLRAVPAMGFTSMSAASAEEALRSMENAPCGVVILDLHLPGMTGIELFRVIRDRWPNTQVVILTGFGDLDTAKEAIRLDVADFLTKPCTLGELEQAIGRAHRRVARASQPTRSNNDLSFHDVPGASRAAASLEEVQRIHILRALQRNQGNRAATARELGISLRTLYYRLAEYERQDSEDPSDA